jgi:hypothetical protein
MLRSRPLRIEPLEVRSLLSLTLDYAGGLPWEGSTSSDPVDAIQLTFSEALDAASAQDPSTWEFVEAGPDETFDTPDDQTYELALASQPALDPPTDWVTLYLLDGPPLDTGLYRFTVRDTLTSELGEVLDGDGDGVEGGGYTRSFRLDLAAPLTLEGTANDALAEATSLTLAEDPPGSGYFMARGLGAIDPMNAGDEFDESDWWSFDALAGDQVAVAADGGLHGDDMLVGVYDSDTNRLFKGAFQIP